MFLFADVDGQRSLDSMKFPVFSLLTGNFTAETSSLLTASSSGESRANLTSACCLASLVFRSTLTRVVKMTNSHAISTTKVMMSSAMPSMSSRDVEA